MNTKAKLILTAAIAATIIAPTVRAQSAGPTLNVWGVREGSATNPLGYISLPSLSIGVSESFDGTDWGALAASHTLSLLEGYDGTNPVTVAQFEIVPDGSHAAAWAWQTFPLSLAPLTPHQPMLLTGEGVLSLAATPQGTATVGAMLTFDPANGRIYSTAPDGVGETDFLTLAAAEQVFITPAEVQSLIANPVTILHVGEALTVGNATIAGDATGSIAAGANAYAGGSNALAVGDTARAEQLGSVAIGARSKSTTKHSIAIGEDSEASGTNSVWWQAGYDWGSVAVGTKARATGKVSAAFGNNAYAAANESVAVGPKAYVSVEAVGGVALGWEAYSASANGMALGNCSRAWSPHATAIGTWTFGMGNSSAILGAYADSTTTGQIVLGTAPVLPPASSDWDDLDASILILGGGKPGPYIGGDWDLDAFAVTRATAMSVTRGGIIKTRNTGGLTIPAVMEVKAEANGTGKILIAPQGDIAMGEFTSGPVPTGYVPPTQ